MNKLVYQATRKWNKDRITFALNSDDPEMIQQALLCMISFIDSFEWAQEQCLVHVSSENMWVAKTAIACLGHLARIHRKIDRSKVFPALELAKKREDLVYNVEDALDDIEMFANK